MTRARQVLVHNQAIKITYLYKMWYSSGSSVGCLQFLLVLVKLTNHVSANMDLDDSDENYSTSGEFWSDVHGAEFVEKLNSSNLEKFNKEYSETFIMFYTEWCRYSIESKGEFANASKEIVHTEGFSKFRFGAFDCDTTPANSEICDSLNVDSYPYFQYFKNGYMDKTYPDTCDRHSVSFYNWIISRGNDCSEKSKLLSSKEAIVTTTTTVPSVSWHPTPASINSAAHPPLAGAMYVSCIVTLCFRLLSVYV